MNHSQPPPTMHNLNLRLSTTNVVQPKPTINFRPKTAFVRCSQRFEMRNRRKMHTAYNTALADRTTHRTTPVPNPHQSSALHAPFRQLRITTPMSGRTPVPGLAQRPSPHACINGSCVATTSRFAVWTDFSRMLLCKSELRRARRRDGNFMRRTRNRGEVGTLGQHAWYGFSNNFVLWETSRQNASPNAFKFTIRQQRLRW